jgi:hypothetical protein
VENDFEMFAVPGNWREDAEQSETIRMNRLFREIVALQIEEASVTRLKALVVMESWV